MSTTVLGPSVSLPCTPVCETPSKKKWSGALEEVTSPVRTLLYGGGPGKRKKLHGFPTKEVADEMTLLDAGLLRLIKTKELEKGAWMKKDKV